ncbi:unnamed protein product [Penicillium salamii]|uniref:protein-tyrosine-phosphatase n=1 Tax=Penicillium salamii TaxID=1612424 RepID=A0A9W4J2N5_9EURO|nr:unnamed protein product [Penicillium salamii]
MGDNAKAEVTEAERNKRWEMAYKARMRQIVPGLFLGNVEASYKRQMLQENQINTIVSLTSARFAWWRSTTRAAGIPEHRHKWVQCADSSTQDLLVYMSDICDFIDQMAAPALSSLSSLSVECNSEMDDERPDPAPEAILIHCELGISRSPTIIIAYLMRKLNIQQADAFDIVRQKQRIRPSKNLTRQLQVWEECRFQVWENEDRTVPKPAYKAFLEDRADLLREKGLTGNEPLAPLTL